MFSRIIRSFTFLPQEVVVVAAKRTPIGSFMSALSTVPAPVLASHAIKAALAQAKLKPNQVTEVILGHVIAAGAGQSPARQAAIFAGLPNEVICTGVNKLCASGLKAITLAAQGIALGHSEIVVAGGMENMSLVPFILPNFRTGHLMGDAKIHDGLNLDGLSCPFNKIMMGGCTEKTVLKYELTREQQDKYCVQSYIRSAEAWKRGFFKTEVGRIEVQTKKGSTFIEEDEEFRKVKFDKIPTLKPVFEKNGTITAANSSKISDGACAVVLMSASRARSLGIKPLARIISFADAETEPVHFSVAPKDAMLKALERGNVSKERVDLFEINEAFSAAALLNMKLLELDNEKVNVNGGAVSLGHPVGMSGARLVSTLIYSLKEQQKNLGLVGICNGGGGATSLLLEVI